MKKKFSKVLGVVLALVLAFSLGIVAAPAPAKASDSVSNVWVQLGQQDGGYASAASDNYSIYFTPGVDLTKAVDTISIIFPSGTDASGVTATADVEIDPDGDIVHSIGTAITVTPSSSTLVLVVTTPVDLTAGVEARLDIINGKVTNPTATVPTAKTLELYTSKETTHVTSSPYTIAATRVTGVDFAIPDPAGTDNWTAGKAVVYTVTFTNSGAAGALVGGVDTVSCIFPTDTTVPTSILKGDVEFSAAGGAYADVSAVSVDGRVVTVTVPADLGTGAQGIVRFTTAAGIRNGTLATNTETAYDNSAVNLDDYVGKVYTNRDVAIINDATPYLIYPTTVSKVGFAATSATLVEVNTASSNIIIQSQDMYGNLQLAGTAQAIGLTSNTTGTATFTPPSPTIAAAASSATFTYKDTVIGTWTITATAPTTTWTAGTWDITVEVVHAVELWHAGVLVATYSDIRTALPIALDGDTIKVSPGTYVESVVGGIALGIDVANLTLEATGTAAETIIDPDARGDVIRVDANGVTIKGFTVRNSNTVVGATDNLTVVDSATGGTTINLTVEDCIFDLTVGAGADNGIDFQANGGAITGVTVTGCTFNGRADTTAIRCVPPNANATTFTATGSTFTGGTGVGLEIDSLNAAVTATVTDNSFDGLEKALDIAESAGNVTTVTVQGNTIKNSTAATTAVGAIEIADDPVVTIVSNTFENNADYAIQLADGTDIYLAFNNLTGNPDGVRNTATTTAQALVATHNWWNDVLGPGGVGPGTGDPITTFITYEPWLSSSISAGRVVTGAITSLDAQVAAGVKVSGVSGATGTTVIGAASYTANPKATPTEFTPLADGFFDVFVKVPGTAANTPEIGIKFYPTGITSDSKLYVWDAFGEVWELCSHQDYNATYGFVYAKVHPAGADVETIPTIADLEGIPFAVGTPEVVRTLQSIAVTPATASIIVGGTKQFTATGTYDVAPLTEDITTTVTWASSATSVATIAATGLATGVAVGNTNITATLGAIVSDPAVLTVTLDDILAYYRGLGDDPLVVETSDLLQAADDWLADVVPDGFTVAITTAQLLTLADEWIAAG